MILSQRQLTSRRIELDTSDAAFGSLHPANDILVDPAALQTRMAEDGYLYLQGYLDKDQVLAARLEITNRLAARGMLDPDRPTLEAVTHEGVAARGDHDLAANNAPLARLLYRGA